MSPRVRFWKSDTVSFLFISETLVKLGKLLPDPQVSQGGKEGPLEAGSCAFTSQTRQSYDPGQVISSLWGWICPCIQMGLYLYLARLGIAEKDSEGDKRQHVWHIVCDPDATIITLTAYMLLYSRITRKSYIISRFSRGQWFSSGRVLTLWIHLNLQHREKHLAEPRKKE